MNKIATLASTAVAAVAATLAVAAPASAQPTVTPHRVAQAKSFDHSQIKKAHAQLDDRFVAAPKGIVSWGADPKMKSVVVSVLASDKTALAKAKSVVAGVPAAQIVLVDEAPRPLWNVIDGQAIRTSSGARCSAGFAARDGSGNRFLITAGHCTNLGGTWSGVGGTIGPVSASSFPTNDYGKIAITSATALSTPLVDRYSSGSDVTVSGPATAITGSAVCRSGSTTGWHCGNVQALNQTVNYGSGNIIYGLIRTNVCAEPGDSGGALVSNPGTGTRVTALGMTSGGSGNCTSGGTTFYQPVTEALSVYHLTLVTG